MSRLIIRCAAVASAVVFPAVTLMASRATPAAAPRPGEDSARVLRGHKAGVTAVRYSPSGRWLVSSSLDGDVRVWSAIDDRVIRVLPHGAELYDVAVSRDSRLIAATGGDGKVTVWNAGTGTVARRMSLPERALAIAFMPGGDLIVGSSNGRIKLIDVASGNVRREMGGGPEVFAVASSADGRYVASGLPLALWDAARGTRVVAPRGFAQGDVAFSPDGRWLASGEYTGGARIFALPGGDLVARLPTEEEKNLQGPSGPTRVKVNMPVAAVEFSPDSKLLATGGGDRRVQLWPVTPRGAGEKPRVLEGHSMTVTGVSFSPDGKTLATGALDHTVRIWSLR